MADDKNNKPQTFEGFEINKSLGNLQNSMLTEENKIQPAQESDPQTKPQTHEFIARSLGGFQNSVLPKESQILTDSTAKLTISMLPKEKPEEKK